MNTALLSLEFQNDYSSNGKSPLEKSVEACNKFQAILHAMREAQKPVFHIQHISTEPDAYYFLPCTKGAEINPAVAPIKGETIIKKHYPNSFKDTNLLKYLIERKINHLVVCGMMTHLAVDSTVRAAHDYGFNVTVVYDACAGKALDINQTHIPAQTVHDSFMAAFQANYANVVTTDELLHRYGTRVQLAAMA